MRSGSAAPAPVSAAGGLLAAGLLLGASVLAGQDPDEVASVHATVPEPRSSRADIPLSGSARAWIHQHRALIREMAERVGVSPLALAGVVAAERTLLRDPFDGPVDGLFRATLATMTEEQLRRWVSAQEAGYRRQLRESGDPALRLVKSPYLWSVGPAQISFRNAVAYEPRLARLEGRPRRSLREVAAALLTPRGSLEYAAVILLEAQEAYARYAGVDLSRRPGILATLYHLGSPARRALRLEEKNRRREVQGEAAAVPVTNFYGEFVERNVDDLEELLR